MHVLTPPQDQFTQFPQQKHNIQKSTIPFVQNRSQYQTIPTSNMILNLHNSAVTPSPQNNQPVMFSGPPRTTIQPSDLGLCFSSLTGLNNNCTTDYSIQDKKENTSNIPNSRDSTIHNQVYSCIGAGTVLKSTTLEKITICIPYYRINFEKLIQQT